MTASCKSGPVHFEGLAVLWESSPASLCFYKRVAFRAPRAGEWYLSGAIPAAYRARSDMATRFHVVRPTFYAVARTVYECGKPVI